MPSALLLGGASCVWIDAAAAFQLSAFDAIAAVNDAGVTWPGHLDFWVSFHTEPNRLPRWIAERAARGFEQAQIVAAHSPEPFVNYTVTKFPGLPSTGTSALLAVKVLRDHAFDRIVLAGCPIDRDAGHFVRQEPWADADKYRETWAVIAPVIAPYVRSMSGWTRDLLGAPVAAFLK